MTPDKSRHDRAIRELNRKRLFPKRENPIRNSVIIFGVIVAVFVGLLIVVPHRDEVEAWYRNPRNQAYLLLGLSLFVALWAFVKWRNRNY
jgi:hypothetical protein